MTVRIDLPPEAESELRQKGLEQGRQADDYVAALVLSDLRLETIVEQPQEKSLAEMLAGRIGLFAHEGPGYQADESGFGDYLAEKHKTGHL